MAVRGVMRCSALQNEGGFLGTRVSQPFLRPIRCQHHIGRSRKLTPRIRAVGWDPEGILAAPQAGHINRRAFSKQVESDKELQEQVERLKKQQAEELRKKREARKTPESHAELIEYFFETESEEMQYETARRRPMLTEDFFVFLDKEIGSAKFSAKPDEGKVAELEGLKEFLGQAISLIDAKAVEMAAPAARMRKLLTAPDKRATLLQMAGDNEIDKGLLDLLQQNIDAARAAGQSDPAAFMEKVRDAAKKFML